MMISSNYIRNVNMWIIETSRRDSETCAGQRGPGVVHCTLWCEQCTGMGTGRLFMVILCPTDWGWANIMSRRAAEQMQTLSTGCCPWCSSSCDIQDRPPSTLHPDIEG